MLFEHIFQAVSLEEVPKPIRLQWYQARDKAASRRKCSPEDGSLLVIPLMVRLVMLQLKSPPAMCVAHRFVHYSQFQQSAGASGGVGC